MPKELSRSLSQELGSCFSYANRRNRRQFYLTYPDYEIGYMVRSKLSWSNNRLIMRMQDDAARNLPTEQEWKQELETKYRMIAGKNNDTGR